MAFYYLGTHIEMSRDDIEKTYAAGMCPRCATVLPSGLVMPRDITHSCDHRPVEAIELRRELVENENVKNINQGCPDCHAKAGVEIIHNTDLMYCQHCDNLFVHCPEDKENPWKKFVAPVRKKYKRVVNFYPPCDCSGSSHPWRTTSWINRTLADQNAEEGRIACIEVEFFEGEGL